MLARTLDVVTYRDLLRNLVTRDLKVRYRGSFIGFLWSLLNPVLMMAVYWFVFTKLLKSDKPQFHIFVFVALLPWNWCASSVMGAISSIVGNGHLIKKVYFPRELLPLSVVISNGINFLFALPVLFVLMALADGSALHTFVGHGQPVGSVAFAPDGVTLASAGDDHTVRLWNTQAGSAVGVLTGHSGPVDAVAFAPNGQTVASGGEDHTVRIWRVADGTPLRVLETGSVIRSVAFTPDGQFVAAGAQDGGLRVWRTSDGVLVRTLTVPGIPIWSVAFAPDSRTLAAGMDDGTVRLWSTADIQNATSGAPRVLNAHQKAAVSVAFALDSQTLAAGGTDGGVRLWRMSDGTLQRTLAGTGGAVYSVAFAPDGQAVATGSADHGVRIWKVADGSVAHSFEGHSGKVNSVAFAPDGLVLASASDDATVRTWAPGGGMGMHFSPYIAWIPLLIVTQALFLGGVSFFLASLNVFFRDTAAIMEVGIQAWFFLTPVIYSAEDVLPKIAYWMYWLNPMASVISTYRIILYDNGLNPHGTGPDPAFLLRTLLTSAVVLVAGYLFFHSLSRKFGEEL